MTDVSSESARRKRLLRRPRASGVALGRRALLLGVGLLLAAHCKRPSKPQEAERPRAPLSSPDSLLRRPAASASAGKAEAGAPEFRYVAPGRLVAFGDVHGDVEAARRALRLAGAVDTADNWIGGNLVVVQTGDQLDRGDTEREILDWWSQLAQEARADGGTFHVLNGNHEAMNVAGDFSYVTPGGFAEFEQFAREPERQQLLTAFPENARGRAAAFLPGGAYARLLARRKAIIVVGDSVFVHGGLLEEHVKYGIGRINQELRQWMRGEVTRAPDVVSSDRSPLWIRDYGQAEVDPKACRALDGTLAALGVKRLVIGHTIQKAGINSACDGRVWRVDVALASFFGNNPTQVLEIDHDQVRVLGGTGAPASPPAKPPSSAAPATSVKPSVVGKASGAAPSGAAASARSALPEPSLNRAGADPSATPRPAATD